MSFREHWTDLTGKLRHPLMVDEKGRQGLFRFCDACRRRYPTNWQTFKQEFNLCDRCTTDGHATRILYGRNACH